MAVRIFAVLMGLFSLVLVFLGMQEFYVLDFEPPSVDFKNIEANKLDVYELNSSLAKANYKANAWERYADKDVFNNVFVYGFDFNLSSNKLSYANGDILLQGKVRYADNNQSKIETERLFYDKAKQKISTKSNFKAYQKESIVTGTAFEYDLEGKKMRIQGVRAWLD